MSEITMPRLSTSMEEGTILKWLVADGQPVSSGDELVEIETDKATVTHTADLDGMLEVLAPEGANVPVDMPIARILPRDAVGAGEPGTGGSEQEAGGSEGATADELPVDSMGAPSVAPAPASGPAAAPNGRGGGGKHADVPASPPPALADAPAVKPVEGTAAATPLARRIARAHHVQLGGVTGTGPRGRITRADVLAAAGIEDQARPVYREPVETDGGSAERAARTGERGPVDTRPAVGAPASEAAGLQGTPTDARGERTIVGASRVQQLIARRMLEAKSTVPHFQVQAEVVMDATLALREQLKGLAAGGTVPSVNDLVVKACAMALRQHPRANGSYKDDHFELHGRINIGLAVAAADALLVPVIFDADTKSLGQIARESRSLAERARSGQLGPADLSGATFTVSNLGMYGMVAIVPVIDPPQAAILGVGAVRETLAREGADIVDRKLMTLTLSSDHRILYGADASLLLADVKNLLESPLQLAL